MVFFSGRHPGIWEHDAGGSERAPEKDEEVSIAYYVIKSIDLATDNVITGQYFRSVLSQQLIILLQIQVRKQNFRDWKQDVRFWQQNLREGFISGRIRSR